MSVLIYAESADGKIKKGVLDRANQQNVTVADKNILLGSFDKFINDNFKNQR
jgi:hypothetical protein